MKLLFLSAVLLLVACNPSKQIAKSAKQNIVEESALLNAHVGISIYEPATGKYLYSYEDDKYFVPASNTKIPTCYAAMKYLGDSLVGLKVVEYDYDLFILGAGDPSFLIPQFPRHPVFDFIKGLKKSPKNIWVGTGSWQVKPWGPGWSWSDYDKDYMSERSGFPIYGNLVQFSGRPDSIKIEPTYFYNRVESNQSYGYINKIERAIGKNDFKIYGYGSNSQKIGVPFITSDTLFYNLLVDTLNLGRRIIPPGYPPPVLETLPTRYVIHSQPTDSLLKPMMHHSDNFFAEQSLLMVSNEKLGVMNDAKIIDTILKTDFKDLPQKPTWADGSGLSRYNLFTPQDMVAILNKMKSEFGMERIKEIFPTGGEGTLSNYYKSMQGFIFAKTGTLTGVVALSGFLYTKKNRLLIFSVLVNNHKSSATEVRRAVEKFIQAIRNEY